MTDPSELDRELEELGDELESKRGTEPYGFKCTVPGCGRAFTNPQGLGAHKRAAHGIRGTSKGQGKAKQQEKGKEPKRVTQKPRGPASRQVAKRQRMTREEMRTKLLNVVVDAIVDDPKVATQAGWMGAVDRWVEDGVALLKHPA